ncbi:nucleoside phosphorylase-I family protein [Facilibium subflavum]|uniref:hypothetical protein n=1 Tax=Facilibium subflavum TaxID=2219058 RepID=UPI000E659636|nr:hypothetical protein [Facilibium subflavum]
MIVEEIAEEMMYHISLSKTMIKHADYAILPGDPARVELIAKTLDPNSYPLASHREYTSYLSYMRIKG